MEGGERRLKGAYLLGILVTDIFKSHYAAVDWL